MRTAARIIETVEKLIKKYDTRDPYELCKCLGIKIHFYDMEKKFFIIHIMPFAKTIIGYIFTDKRILLLTVM